MGLGRASFVCGALAGLGAGAVGYGLYWLTKKLLNRKKSSNPYEAGKVVDEYMAFHYTPPEDYLAHPSGPKQALNFPRRCAELCLKHKQEGVLDRALDVGCAVGCSAFELARGFGEVVGLDFSHAFIQRCQELKMTGQSAYWLSSEGKLGETKMAQVYADIDRTRVSFVVGDACRLPDLGQFGCVLAANLICRLPNPGLFLQKLPDLVVPGGVLIITSPYSWSQDFTPQDKWIGGYVNKDGIQVWGFDTLKQILGPHFELLEETNMPFLIRETVRKHQWTMAHATIWKRKM